MSTIHLTLTLEISFDAPADHERLPADLAESAIRHAMGNGAFTLGLPYDEIIVWSQHTKTTQA